MLTELTRNPPSTRSAIEKNWLLFFQTTGESYIHYELPSFTHPATSTRGRTFAKILGNGLTTTNLTSPLEQPCLDSLIDNRKREAPSPSHLKFGSWHQATNSLRLILCNRRDKDCRPTPQNTVFVALIHRKFPNLLKLPLRYERFFIAWSATPPFGMVGISRNPVLLANETASGFLPSENWPDDGYYDDVTDDIKHDSAARIGRRDAGKAQSNMSEPISGAKKENWAGFTYTVSMAYAWGRRQPRGQSGREAGGGHEEVEDMHVGYLDDEVVLGIGVDDVGQSFARLEMRELVACMRACPGMGAGGEDGEGSAEGEGAGDME